MHKIELHLHTKYVSRCGKMEAKPLVEGYLAAGYSAVVVTDHYNRETFERLGLKMSGDHDFLAAFLEGYRQIKAAGEPEGLKVYRGAEVRFDGSMNDYLVLNYPDELLAEPERVFTMGLEAFSKLARQSGALIIQAHPFRKKCAPADHRWLDGVEVKNLHPGHESHNALAQEFADRWPDLIRVSGSDCHERHHMARGGIRSETLPENEQELAVLLRSGNFSLVG